jgi:YNFM family putative membrane transporter
LRVVPDGDRDPRPAAQPGGSALAALACGAAAMFAVMYSTQAVLPRVAADFEVPSAVAGLTISVVVLGVALGGWLLGPLSDRVGRKRVMVGSGLALIVPTALLAVAPDIQTVLLLRLAQGLCMPGLLSVAVPYLHERFPPSRVGFATGLYTTALVAGGLLGRLVPAAFADGWGWQVGLAVLALPLALGMAAMARWVPGDEPHPIDRATGRAVRLHLRNPALLLVTVAGGATVFTYAATFSYVAFRLEGQPFDLSTRAVGLVFAVWAVGLLAPVVGRHGARVGPERLLPACAALGLAACLLERSGALPVLVLGLALTALALFATLTLCQLLVPRSVTHNRGVAATIYLTGYYGAAALGAFLPGEAWDAAGWDGVLLAAAGALGIALVAGLVLRRHLARAAVEARTPAGIA